MVSAVHGIENAVAVWKVNDGRGLVQCQLEGKE